MADENVIKPDNFKHHIERFNAMAEETVVNLIPNAESWDWLQQNIPFFECPDNAVEEIYYFRWWSFRKHLKQTPKGFVFTEFLTPVGHAGDFNTVSCALGHHIAEGRWLHDRKPIDQYMLYWLRGSDGKPAPKFYKFSNWLAAAAWERYLVAQDKQFLLGILDDLVTDYGVWERDRQLPSGLFWQHDVKDGMEESISGSRREQQARPTINSYMFANARAIHEIALLADRPELAREFGIKAEVLRKLTSEYLWDPELKFFTVRHPEKGFAKVREAIGFIPWRFHLPRPGAGYEVAWAQLMDEKGFRAPFGVTTAERRHPKFRSSGIGTCEWDGALWPFATSQTLDALANVLCDYPQDVVTASDYFDVFRTYVKSQYADGKPFIGEYQDEVTGAWINRGDRSAFYNHSTFADSLITGLMGLRPRADDVIKVHPLVPAGTWDWFCLDRIQYHGRSLTILWDKDGTRYGRGACLQVLADGEQIASSDALVKLSGVLPKS
ncbi:MAG: glycoside hydrolase [Verrucomicrobiae bacterium]|nr:glycoside hydrolase [Verrucomicrobiae bacterium]